MRLIFIDEDGTTKEEVPVANTVDPIDAEDPLPYLGDPE